MSRHNKWGQETQRSQYCRLLWSSDKVSDEEKKWIDSISNRTTLKFSEEKLIEGIYERVFGVKEPYPDPDYCG